MTSTQGIDDNMALAALDLFYGIVAPFTIHCGRLHALAIDDGDTWFRRFA